MFYTPEEIMTGWRIWRANNPGPVPTGRLAEFVRDALHWCAEGNNS